MPAVFPIFWVVLLVMWWAESMLWMLTRGLQGKNSCEFYNTCILGKANVKPYYEDNNQGLSVLVKEHGKLVL